MKEAVATWHADKAIKHYLSGEFDDYARHIYIADAFRRSAWLDAHKKER